MLCTSCIFVYLQNGLIRAENDDYMIEPVKNASVHGSSGFIGQPHKLYKRSLMEANNQHRYEAQKQGRLCKVFLVKRLVNWELCPTHPDRSDDGCYGYRGQ